MGRWFTVVVALVGAAVTITTAAGAATRTEANRGGPGHGGGLRYFAIGCGFSHSNMDDAIVFPGQVGRSHDHTYFGNRTTNAASTPESLRAAGRTSCRLRADTAAYWVPTLFNSGNARRAGPTHHPLELRLAAKQCVEHDPELPVLTAFASQLPELLERDAA